MPQYRVKTDASFEVYGIEIVMPIIINFSCTPYIPARIHPVDKAHPAEGGEIEDVEIEILDDTHKIARELEEAIAEAVENGDFEREIDKAFAFEEDKEEALREDYEEWKRELREKQAFC